MAASALSLADLQNHDPGAKTSGVKLRFLCPFPGVCTGHQNPKIHRSISVNAQTGAWQCWRCHNDGKLREWHTAPAERAARPFVSPRDRDRNRLRSLLATAPPSSPLPASSKTEADPDTARDLARLLAGVKPLEKTKGAAYLEGRGLPVDFCHGAGARFHQNYLGRTAVVFSLRDAAGLTVALHGRYIDGREDPKSRTRGPMPQAVFATPGAWNGDPWHGRVVITEAPIDALTLAFCGVPALALCGTSGGKDLLREKLALKQAVAAFDNDADAAKTNGGVNAGNRASRALTDLLFPVGAQVFRLLPPDGAKDWNEALARVGRSALRDYLAGELSEADSQVGNHGSQTVSPGRQFGGDLDEAAVPDELIDLVPQARELDAYFDAQEAKERAETDAEVDVEVAEMNAETKRRQASLRTLRADAENNALPVVPVVLGPGRISENPNVSACLALADLKEAAPKARGEGNVKPSRAWWEAKARAALNDLDALAAWWETQTAKTAPVASPSASSILTARPARTAKPAKPVASHVELLWLGIADFLMQNEVGEEVRVSYTIRNEIGGGASLRYDITLAEDGAERGSGSIGGVFATYELAWKAGKTDAEKRAAENRRES